ncbi:DUF5691 domain-containing protein [Roseateles sp. UC29_93]|uniref:DUF5691 domain-containing protein n=1 Tax=Roseateles sp. UC29_93 TaxID=3350177 RepID=UPI00366DDDEE
MSAWTPLLPVAMVGTDRQPGPLPEWPGEIGALVALAAQAADVAGHPAGQVLRTMAVIAPCEAAGMQDRVWTAPLPEAAADDRLGVVPARVDGAAGSLHTLLRWVLTEAPGRLQQQAFMDLAAAGLRLPESLLPLALDVGRRAVALRAPLLPVLGERGLWLARQREDWHYAAGAGGDAPGETHWTEGTLEQRRAFLARERAVDATAARSRLESALTELSAKERADLVAQLAVGLGMGDEALLDRLRADRSREVRDVALDLLLRLPDAAHPRRAIERLAPLVRRERALLRQHWVIDAPQAAAADWPSDQMVVARPSTEKLGERAWWLYQLVRQVPLGWWTTTTSMTPAELLGWAAKTDWSEAMMRGWFDALAATREVEWCEAFLDALQASVGSAAQANVPLQMHQTAQALNWLPQARRERHWLRHVQQGSLPLSALIAAASGGETLGTELSRALTGQLLTRARAGTLKDDYAVRAMLVDFGAVVHADSLSAYASLADIRAADETAAHAEQLQAVAQTAALRRALLALPNPLPNALSDALSDAHQRAPQPDSIPRTS